MYAITLDNLNGTCYPPSYIYNPIITVFPISDIKLNKKLNEAGTLEFKIYPEHAAYSILDGAAVRRKHLSVVELEDDGTLDESSERVFAGEVDEITTDKYGVRTVYCVGVLSYFKNTWYQGGISSTTADYYLAGLIIDHNRKSANDYASGEPAERSIRGFFRGSPLVPNTILENVPWNTAVYTRTYDLIQTLCSDYHWYIYISYAVNATRPTISMKFLNGYGKLNESQSMAPAVNIIDQIQNVKGGEIANVIIPYGKNRLDIRTVNDGVDYIIDQASANKYGYIWEFKTWNDVTEPSYLKMAAEEYLKFIKEQSEVRTIKAVDLKDAGYDVDRFKLGDRIRIIDVDGTTMTLPISAVSLDLQRPEQNSYTVGVPKVMQKFISGKVEKNEDEIIDLDARLQAVSGTADASSHSANLRIDDLERRVAALEAANSTPIIEEES